MENNINWLSLVLSTIVPTIIGMIYYSKPLFQKPWMAAIGMTEEKQKAGNMPVMMVGSLIAAFLISFFMMQFTNGAGQEGEFDSFKHGAMHGVIVSIFLIIPIFISRGLFAQASFKGVLIDGFYWLITLAAMGAIMDGMNHFTYPTM